MHAGKIEQQNLWLRFSITKIASSSTNNLTDFVRLNQVLKEGELPQNFSN